MVPPSSSKSALPFDEHGLLLMSTGERDGRHFRVPNGYKLLRMNRANDEYTYLVLHENQTPITLRDGEGMVLEPGERVDSFEGQVLVIKEGQRLCCPGGENSDVSCALGANELIQMGVKQSELNDEDSAAEEVYTVVSPQTAATQAKGAMQKLCEAKTMGRIVEQLGSEWKNAGAAKGVPPSVDYRRRETERCSTLLLAPEKLL